MQNMVANILSASPPDPLGWDQKVTEYGHVAYQIKGHAPTW